MSSINTVPQTSNLGLLAGIRNFFAAWADAYAMRSDYLRTVAELEQLTDRELADIGVVRGEIRAIAARRALDHIS